MVVRHNWKTLANLLAHIICLTSLIDKSIYFHNSVKISKNGAVSEPTGIPIICLITFQHITVLWKIFNSLFQSVFGRNYSWPSFFFPFSPKTINRYEFPTPYSKQKSINSLITFNKLSWGIFVLKVAKSKHEEVAFPLPLKLLRASITTWLFKMSKNN